MKTKAKKQTAVESYAATAGQAMRLAELIVGRIGDMPAPSDEIDWGHAGSAALIVERLREVIEVVDGHS
jgi:hypothetical protein